MHHCFLFYACTWAIGFNKTYVNTFRATKCCRKVHGQAVGLSLFISIDGGTKRWLIRVVFSEFGLKPMNFRID